MKYINQQKYLAYVMSDMWLYQGRILENQLSTTLTTYSSMTMTINYTIQESYGKCKTVCQIDNPVYLKGLHDMPDKIIQTIEEHGLDLSIGKTK